MASNLIAGLIFGSIGFVAFIYGKKQASAKHMVIGGLLLAYTYFVPNVIAVYAIGAVLTLALFFPRD
jgi:hypothetical protein